MSTSREVLREVKGMVDASRPEAQYQVDGISGATITARGVSNMVRFWLGEDGFKRYLNRIKEQA